MRRVLSPNNMQGTHKGGKAPHAPSSLLDTGSSSTNALAVDWDGVLWFFVPDDQTATRAIGALTSGHWLERNKSPKIKHGTVLPGDHVYFEIGKNWDHYAELPEKDILHRLRLSKHDGRSLFGLPKDELQNAELALAEKRKKHKKGTSAVKRASPKAAPKAESRSVSPSSSSSTLGEMSQALGEPTPTNAEVQVIHGKRNRDTDEEPNSPTAQEEEQPREPTESEVTLPQKGDSIVGGDEDEQESASGEKEADDVPEPKTPTNKDFNKLIRDKNSAVSWVGNYTTAHETGIEIGFLKKEAMALTTLVSYYQVDGAGATACPIALISSPASFGRKLAIFYSSCETMRSTGHRWWQSEKRDKVGLGTSFKMENQPLKTLAKLGRADFYFGTFKEYLEKGPKKKIPATLDMTKDGRLVLTHMRCHALCGKNVKAELEIFVREIFQSGQIDVADLLTRHLQFDPFTLHGLCSLAMDNGHLALAELLFDREPGLVNGGAHVPRLLRLALMSERVTMVKLCVRHGADVNQVDKTFLGYDNLPLHNAMLGKESRSYSGYVYEGQSHRQVTEVVQFLLEAGAKVDVRNELGQTPLCMAISARYPDAVRMLKNQLEQETGGPVDLVTQSSQGRRVDKSANVEWLKSVGLI